MNLRIVLFEDPTVRGFRPLSASVPQFEVRCGACNLRERVELAGAVGGELRLRDHLLPLALDPAWTATAGDGPGRRLWLGGRLAPSCDLVEALLGAATGDFVLRDGRGVLAASLTGDEAAAWDASWRELAARPWGADAAWEPPVPGAWQVLAQGDGGEILGPPRQGEDLAVLVSEPALDWIWDVVPRTARALTGDLERLCARELARRPWGVVGEAAAPTWSRPGTLRPLETLPPGVHADDPSRVWAGEGVTCAPGVVIDTAAGPVLLDAGARIGPHVLLAGPLYMGRDSRVKAGARVYGESSFGVGARLAGEIGESTFGDFANKQHEGFIGHAVLGSWINLGAMTTNSDLKNNYGPVRVDQGEGARDTGRRFVGLLAGDHVKTAIGTLFNTGTVVGFASNVFGDGMPPKFVRAFSWGGTADAPRYDAERAMATARVVMARRECVFTDGHEHLFSELASG